MQVYIGIDWSEDKHDVVFMNQVGVDVARLTILHSLDGLVQLDAARRKPGLAQDECTLCWLALRSGITFPIMV